jgi:hypothetical protein
MLMGGLMNGIRTRHEQRGRSAAVDKRGINLPFPLVTSTEESYLSIEIKPSNRIAGVSLKPLVFRKINRVRRKVTIEGDFYNSEAIPLCVKKNIGRNCHITYVIRIW